MRHSSLRSSLTPFALVSVLPLVACGTTTASPAADAAAEAAPTTDAVADVSRADAAADALPDQLADAAADVAAVADASLDVTDAASTDASTDAPADAPSDVDASDAPVKTFPDNAVAIWDFEDGLAATTALDSSGNGHTATLTGGAVLTASGKKGGALSIVNASPNIAFADVTGGPIFDNTKDFSIGFWFFTASGVPNNADLLSLDGANTSVVAFSLSVPPSQGECLDLFFPVTDTAAPASYVQAYSTTPLPQGGATNYNYLTGVFTAATGTLAVYENGVAQTNAADSPFAAGTAPVKAVGDFIIGAGKSVGVRKLGPSNALYDGVRVYAYALSPAQVMSLYALAGD